MTMNAADYFLPQDAASEKTVLIEANREVSYASLISQSNCVSILLKQAGIQEGERILILSENSCFWTAVYVGSLRIGVIPIPLSPSLSAAHLNFIVEQSEPKLVFIQEKHLPKLEPLLSSLPLHTSLFEEAGVDLPPGFSFSGEGLACIMYTSGSTGKPRGVMVSHRNIIANTHSILSYLDLDSSDRMMVVLPFYYCFGTSLLHTHLRARGSLVLSHEFMFPDKVLRQMQEAECTGFAGVPSTYHILLRNSSLRRMDFPHWKYLLQAGGRLAPDFIHELRQLLPRTKIFIMYGQTEATARISYLPPESLETKTGSIGKGIPGVTVDVLNRDGKPVQGDEIGEIVASGENVALGYWKDPEATKKTFRDGVLYTGDLATVDEDGFITIVDRAKDFLKVGGYRVSAQEVEEILLKFPGVQETAVIGIPDDLLGEAIKAFVVHDRFTESLSSQFHTYCVQSLPSHLIPKETIFMDALPKNSSGKVLKSVLRDTR